MNKFGLQISSKNKVNVVLSEKQSIFNESSDEEETTKSRGFNTIKSSIKKAESKQTKMAIENALEEDPTVFEYDAVYDAMEAKRQHARNTKKDADRKPKYIADLKRAAEQRKAEQELREQRIVQREREAEGSEFADKESFVTESYAEKLKERERLKQLDQIRDYIEAKQDVTKKNDLSGFYRTLLSDLTENESSFRSANEKTSGNIEASEEKSSSDEELKICDGGVAEAKKGGLIIPKRRIRQLRKRKESVSSEEEILPSLQSKDSVKKSFVNVSSSSSSENSSSDEESPSKPIKSSSAVKVKCSDPVVEEDPVEVAALRIRYLKKMFEQRNTKETIAAARERYFQRKIAAAAT